SDPAVVATGGFVVTASEGSDSGSQTVATFTDPGGAEGVGDYSASINWGDDSAATNVGTTVTSPALTAKASHTYAEESAADHARSNPYTITVTRSPEAAAVSLPDALPMFSDPAVVATGGFVVTASEGSDSGSQTVATFTDPGGAEGVGDYSASINWGDGSAATSGVITVSAGVFKIGSGHACAQESAADRVG